MSHRTENKPIQKSAALRMLLLSSALATGIGHASAQTEAKAAPAPANDQIGEIVVTATRREEKLSRVPVSITAFSKETLDRRGVRQIDDIVQLTPSLQFTRASGTTAGFASNISIRGVSSLVGAATTGVYIDDTPIQVRSLLVVSGNTFPKAFDLDRVEVLRGPQGTLFGAGSEGGAIRFITTQPDFARVGGMARAEVSATSGGSPSYEIGYAMGGPLVEDKLAARISGWYRRDGGWVDRVDPNNGTILHRNGNSEQSYSGKLALSWKATPDFTLTPSIYFQKIDGDERTQYWENLSSGGDFRAGSLVAEPSSDKFFLPALKAQFDASAFSVISSTSYFSRDYESTYNYTQTILGALGIPPTTPVPAGLPGGADTSNSYVQQRNFTQELRIQSAPGSRFQWVVGAFYAHNKQIGGQHVVGLTTDSILQGIFGAGYEGILGIPLEDGKYTFVTRLTSTEKQEALFGDFTYAITEKLKVSAGIRAAHTSFSYSQTTSGPFAAAEPFTTGGEQSEHPITPKFGISYQADPDHFLYFTAAKGFRIGGAQPQLISSCNEELASIGYAKSPTTYDSDHLWSYEVGSKNALFGGRVRLDGSAFYIDWQNIQSRIQLNSCGGSVIVANLGSAISKGFDLSFQANVVKGVTFSVALGYVDSSYNQTIASSSGAIFSKKGQVIGEAPFNSSVSAQYDFDAFQDARAYLRADYQYHSAGPAPDPTVFGYDPAIPRTPATNYLNLRAGIAKDGWDISAFMNNATNARYALFRSHDALGSELFYNTTVRPISGGVTVIFKY